MAVAWFAYNQMLLKKNQPQVEEDIVGIAMSDQLSKPFGFYKREAETGSRNFQDIPNSSTGHHLCKNGEYLTPRRKVFPYFEHFLGNFQLKCRFPQKLIG